MKYIDADKLIAEIERLSSSEHPIEYEPIEKLAYNRALLEIEGAITSLQQEQPFPRWIHANYSDKPEIRYTPSGIPYLQNGTHMIWLSDLDTLPKDGTDLTNPIQEQPEVDLEKEIKRFLSNATKMNKGEWRGKYPISDIGFRAVARHFYELGKSARKEE